jgi:hypothetical protein
MKWIRSGIAASIAFAAVMAPISALGVTSTQTAGKLQCSAKMSVARPVHNQRVDVLVRTDKGAWVGAFVHFKTGTVRKTTHANTAGRAEVGLNVGRAKYGDRVGVSVYVDKARGKGSCRTSFMPTAPPPTYGVGSCRASGDYAICDEAGNANDPSSIYVHVTSNPDQSVLVTWDDVCSEGLSAGSTSGQFTATTPINRKISHPYAHPDSCTVAAGAQLNDSGSLHVWTDYEK